jgi:hypothetical protein
MGQSDRVYGALQLNGQLKTARAGTAGNLISPPVATEGLGLSRDTMEYDETVGNRAPTAQEYGGRVYEGDIEGAARPNSFGLFLSMVMGPPVTVETLAPSGGDPGVYTHTWNPIRVGNPGPLPASIWTVNRTDEGVDIVDKYVGVKGDSLSLEIANDGYLVFTMGAVGYLLDQTATEPTGVAQDLSKKFPFHVVTAQMAVGGGSLATVPLLDFGLDYNNNIVTDQFVLGSKEVENLPEGNIEPEATFTPAADIEDHYRRSLLDSPEDVRLKLNAQGAIITGIHRYAISVDLKRLQYTEAPVEIDAGETLSGVEVTAAPVLTDDGTGFLEVVLVNSDDGDIYRAPTT